MNDQSSPTPRPTPPPPSAAPGPIYYHGPVNPPPQPAPPPRRSCLGRAFKVILFVALLGFFGLMMINVGVNLGALGPIAESYGLSSGITQHLYEPGRGKQRIAILPITGVIEGGQVRFIHLAVRAILADHAIRAVVLRVESPGGDATASDEIHREIRRIQNEGELPIVASYGDLAASGGYYVSCASDYIIAQPTTITGSIGVIAPYMTFHRLLDKIGVDPQVMTSTAAVDKDTGSMFRAWTDKDRAEIRRLLDSVQEQFVKVVVEGRKTKMTEPQVVAAATGKGLIARQALEANLIDSIGYLDDAIKKARDLGGIAEPHPPVIFYQPRTGIFSSLFEFQSSQRAPAAIWGNVDANTARRWITELAIPRMMYLFQP